MMAFLGLHFSRTKNCLVIDAVFLLLTELLTACANAGDDRVGMSLHFINRGTYRIGVARFAPDGITGPVPGAMGPDGNSQERNKQDSQVGKSMSFMPSDNKRGLPQFVDIEWTVATPQITSMRESRDKHHELYSNAWIAETKEINLATPIHKRRVDLTPILTPELLAQVRANRRNTQLKLKVVFTDDDVGITASAEVWR